MRRRKNKKFVSIITFILAATMLLSVFTVFLIKTNRYNKPTPTIYPESGFMVGKNINWTAVLASDPTGLNKIQREWKGASCSREWWARHKLKKHIPAWG